MFWESNIQHGHYNQQNHIGYLKILKREDLKCQITTHIQKNRYIRGWKCQLTYCNYFSIYTCIDITQYSLNLCILYFNNSLITWGENKKNIFNFKENFRNYVSLTSILYLDNLRPICHRKLSQVIYEQKRKQNNKIIITGSQINAMLKIILPFFTYIVENLCLMYCDTTSLVKSYTTCESCDSIRFHWLLVCLGGSVS